MATNFANAINALVMERDRQFVERIAKEYSLDLEELHKKYLETAEAAIKVPRKYTKKVKSVVVGEGEAPSTTEVAAPKEPKAPKDKPCCTAQTSKKEPCKFSALKGEVFCKRHLKQSLGETEPKAPKAPKEPKAKKPEQPVHTHPLSESDSACDLCASHGNPLEETEQDFEVVVGPVKELTIAERLTALLNEGDSEDEEEPRADSDDETVDCDVDDETVGCDVDECDVEEYEEED